MSSKETAKNLVWICYLSILYLCVLNILGEVGKLVKVTI